MLRETNSQRKDLLIIVGTFIASLYQCHYIYLAIHACIVTSIAVFFAATKMYYPQVIFGKNVPHTETITILYNQCKDNLSLEYTWSHLKNARRHISVLSYVFTVSARGRHVGFIIMLSAASNYYVLKCLFRLNGNIIAANKQLIIRGDVQLTSSTACWGNPKANSTKKKKQMTMK